MCTAGINSSCFRHTRFEITLDIQGEIYRDIQQTQNSETQELLGLEIKTWTSSEYRGHLAMGLDKTA